MPLDDISYYPGDVINRLKKRLSQNDIPRKTWWFMQRIEERTIKFGDGAALATTRTETKSATQELMVVITISTPSEILRKGWPESY